jgi:hypothetical protein
VERSSKDIPNRRTLRPCDIPQNPKDAAALKLLAAVDRQPNVQIVRIAFYSSGGGHCCEQPLRVYRAVARNDRQDPGRETHRASEETPNLPERDCLVARGTPPNDAHG